MIRFCRTSIVVLVVSLAGVPNTFAAGDGAEPLPRAPLTYNGQPIAMPPFVAVSARPVEPVNRASASAEGQWGYRRGRHRRDGAIAAMMLGAAGAIAGTAVLVYANRPECSVNANNSGCGYGTKVVGASVLSAGVAALMIGAVTWR